MFDEELKDKDRTVLQLSEKKFEKIDEQTLSKFTNLDENFISNCSVNNLFSKFPENLTNL